jgi:hypothetical protein
MSKSKSITVSYSLHPPPNTNAPPGLSPTSTRDFSIKAGTGEGDKQYYEELRGAIAYAKTRFGDELTQWRDAVGSAELGKETKKTLKEEEEDDDDEQQP